MFPMNIGIEVEGPWPKTSSVGEVPRHLESHPLAFRCRFCGTYQRVPWMPWLRFVSKGEILRNGNSNGNSIVARCILTTLDFGGWLWDNPILQSSRTIPWWDGWENNTYYLRLIHVNPEYIPSIPPVLTSFIGDVAVVAWKQSPCLQSVTKAIPASWPAKWDLFLVWAKIFEG